MSVQSAYNQWAATYNADPNRTRDLDQAVTRQVLGGQQFASVMEIGCGTGKNTVFYAQIGEQVQALDFSEAMLAQAREKVTAANVQFTATDLTQPWPSAPASADLVACNLVLEHIEDLRPIFAQAARILQAGGRFFISELHPFRQYQGTVANFQRGGATTEIPAFIHHLSDFLTAASASGLKLVHLNEWWHAEDNGKPPRLVTLVFER